VFRASNKRLTKALIAVFVGASSVIFAATFPRQRTIWRTSAGFGGVSEVDRGETVKAARRCTTSYKRRRISSSTCAHFGSIHNYKNRSRNVQPMSKGVDVNAAM